MTHADGTRLKSLQMIKYSWISWISIEDFDSCSGCPTTCDANEPTNTCNDNTDKTFTCLYGFASLTTWTGPDPVLYLDFEGDDNINAMQGSVLFDDGRVCKI